MPSFNIFTRLVDRDDEIKGLREDDSSVEMDDESEDLTNENVPDELQLQVDSDDPDPIKVDSETTQFDEVNEREEIDQGDEISQEEEIDLNDSRDRFEAEAYLSESFLQTESAVPFDDILLTVVRPVNNQRLDIESLDIDPLSASLLDPEFEEQFDGLLL